MRMVEVRGGFGQANDAAIRGHRAVHVVKSPLKWAVIWPWVAGARRVSAPRLAPGEDLADDLFDWDFLNIDIGHGQFVQ